MQKEKVTSLEQRHRSGRTRLESTEGIFGNPKREFWSKDQVEGTGMRLQARDDEDPGS